MAGNFEVIMVEPVVQQIGPDNVRDAQRITFRTLPRGIVFSSEFVTGPQVTAALVEQLTTPIAAELEEDAAHPHVDGIAFVQELDALNQLHERMLIGVTSSSGVSSAVLNVAQTYAYPANFGPLVDAEVARLDALERA